ncbi:MAG: porin [Defluviicoccus sp.]|nr:porin [Defluviicoccus sp.]MDG4591700.1 porin [Defluviicoccus sp.]MDG4601455.1 porin [Defluviicoccus sp.]
MASRRTARTHLSLRNAVSVTMLGLAPAAAEAEERIRVQIGGTMQQWAVVAGQNINTGDGSEFDTAALDQKHNSEIRFLGKTELRNEVAIGFRIELEANTDDQQIGESFLFVEQPTAGLIQIGDTDNVAITMQVAAPDGGISINDGDLLGIEAFVTPEGYEEGNSLIDSTALQLGDDNSGKFSYYTPRFAGVQIGVSYIPRFEDGGSNNDFITRVDSEGPVRNGVAIAVNYAQEFDELEIEAYAGYLFGDTPSAEGSRNIRGAGAGLVVEFADFEIGGSFAWSRGDAPGDTSLNGRSFDIGIAYEFNRYRIGLTYIRGVNEGSRVDPADQRLDQVMLSGTYALEPGVDLVAGIFYYDADGEKDLVAASDGVRSNCGFGFATALEIRF